MKQLSFWARSNRAAAITMIILLKIVLFILAIQLAGLLTSIDFYFSHNWIYWLTGMVTLLFLLYPRGRQRDDSKATFYNKRKGFELVLAMSVFLMMTGWIQAGFPTILHTQVQASTIAKDPTAEEILRSLQYRDRSSLTKKEKRILKKELKHQVKEYVKAKAKGDDRKAEKTILIILTIIGAIGIMVLIAGLACNLICNGGPEALVLILMILGMAAVVLGAILIIRRIVKGPRRRETEPAAATN